MQSDHIMQPFSQAPHEMLRILLHSTVNHKEHRDIETNSKKRAIRKSTTENNRFLRRTDRATYLQCLQCQPIPTIPFSYPWVWSAFFQRLGSGPRLFKRYGTAPCLVLSFDQLSLETNDACITYACTHSHTTIKTFSVDVFNLFILTAYTWTTKHTEEFSPWISFRFLGMIELCANHPKSVDSARRFSFSFPSCIVYYCIVELERLKDGRGVTVLL